MWSRNRFGSTPRCHSADQPRPRSGSTDHVGRFEFDKPPRITAAPIGQDGEEVETV